MNNQDLLELYISALHSYHVKDYIFSFLDKNEYFNNDDLGKYELLETIVNKKLSSNVIEEIDFSITQAKIYIEVASLFNDDTISEMDAWNKFDRLYYSDKAIRDDQFDYKYSLYKNEY